MDQSQAQRRTGRQNINHGPDLAFITGRPYHLGLVISGR
jgi:hypothetical protein